MFSLTQLLPYDLSSRKNGALRSSLKEYQALVRAALQTIHAIQHRDYEKLDSLVGENACEIRAIWLCLQFSEISTNHSFSQDTLLEALNRINTLLEPLALNGLMRSDQSFQSVIEEHNLNIDFSTADFILIISFLLSEMKTTIPNEEHISTIFRIENASPKHLKRYGDVSTSFSLNLISKLRKMLAGISVQFVRKQAFALQDPLLVAMVSDQLTVVHNALPCIPMFWTYKTVLATAQQNQIPIILHAKFLKKSGEGYVQIDEEKLFYQVDENGIYQPVHPDPSDLDQAACIVQGIACIDEDSWSKSEWVSVMSGKSVIDVILAGAADHRQYPDPALDHMFENTQDPEYRIYQQRALAEGFAAKNPSTFFIQHVYAALASKVFSCEEGIFEAPIYASNTVGIL